MKNIMDFMKPTIITAQQYGTKISVELDHSDTDIDELFDAFETICIGLGYHSDGWKQWILDRADEYHNEEFDKNYSFDFPESQIDEALAQHNKDEDDDFVWGNEEEPSHQFTSDNFEDYQNDDLEFQEPNEALKNGLKEYAKAMKTVPKKRKRKSVQQWEDEIDLGGNE